MAKIAPKNDKFTKKKSYGPYLGNVWTIKVVLEFWFGHWKCHFLWSKKRSLLPKVPIFDLASTRSNGGLIYDQLLRQLDLPMSNLAKKKIESKILKSWLAIWKRLTRGVPTIVEDPSHFMWIISCILLKMLEAVVAQILWHISWLLGKFSTKKRPILMSRNRTVQ